MSGRILGSHFNADGKPKRGYEREGDAKHEADRFGLSYYRCDVCNKWHLASRRGGRSLRRRL
jgi:hypothetical protein